MVKIIKSKKNIPHHGSEKWNSQCSSWKTLHAAGHVKARRRVDETSVNAMRTSYFERVADKPDKSLARVVIPVSSKLFNNGDLRKLSLAPDMNLQH